MRDHLQIGGILLILLGISACKPPTAGSNGIGRMSPERVGGEGDAAAAVKVGVLGKDGGSRLAIDLQRPPQGAEAANLWSCWALPTDDFALGRAVCQGDGSKSVEVTAANVNFTCAGNPDFSEVKAKRPLSLDFCPSYEIFAYKFEPAFNIKVE